MNLGLTLCTDSWAVLKRLTLWLDHENEGTKPSGPWNRDHLPESASWGSYSMPLGGKELFSPQWDLSPQCSQDSWKHMICELVHAPLKEGRRWGSWSGIYLLKTESITFPRNTCGLHSLARFPRLRLSPSSSPYKYLSF